MSVVGICLFFKGEQFVFSEISEPMIFRNFWSALKETCWFVLWIYSSWNSSRAPLALSCQTIGQQKGYGRCVWNIILSTGNLRKQPGSHVSSPGYPRDPRRWQRIEWQTRPLLRSSAGSPFVHLSLSPGRAPLGLELVFRHGPEVQLPFHLPARLGPSSAVTGCHLTALTTLSAFTSFPARPALDPAPWLVCQECSNPLNPGHCCTSASSLLALD